MLTEKTFDTGELTLNYAEGPASGPAFLREALNISHSRWIQLPVAHILF